MPNNTSDYTNANRLAWNEAAPFHVANADFQALREGFAKAGFSVLDEVETQRLHALGVEGKDVAQLCCNNGREILSIKNLGAARCVGFDQSSAFLAQAAELKAVGALECQFVEGDIYQTAPEFDSAFDLVVITIGVLGWMPELGKFFDVVVRLLRPGGQLFIHEQHPITNMLEPGVGDPFALVHSYFRREPFADDDIIVYDDEDAGKGKTYYWFVHTLADTITACLERGLVLDHFAEYPTNISSEEFDRFEDREAQLPLSYSLTASKGSPPRGRLKT